MGSAARLLVASLLALAQRADAQAPAFFVRDLNPQPSPVSSSPSGLTNFSGLTYFSASGGAHGAELWRSDGTEAGTMRVRDIAVGASSAPQGLTAVGGTLFFIARDGPFDDELWKSDGTAEGTVRVKDVFPGPQGGASCPCAAAGGLFFFIGFDGGTELPDFPFFIPDFQVWRSDGTAAGTFAISDLPFDGGLPSLLFAEIGGFLVFDADDVVHGRELWRSDGTIAGTGLFAELGPGSLDGNPRLVARFAGALYFHSGNRLMRTDGSSVELVTSVGSGGSGSLQEHAASSGGLLYYRVPRANVNGVMDWELARSDGTAAGTTILDLNPAGASDPRNLTDLDGTLLFSADGGGGRGLWRSDGSAEGTALVSPLALNPNIAWNGEMLLVRETVNELWKSDGTAAGTALIVDLDPGTQGGIATGAIARDPSRQLFAGAGGVYFRGNDGVSGTEPWLTDGTAEGTAQLKNMASDVVGSIENTSGVETALLDLDGTFYFSAPDGVAGHELWRSDGSPGGTARVADLVPGPAGSFPIRFAQLGELLLFRGPGAALYRSDGTEAGTVLVSDVDISINSRIVTVGPSAFFYRHIGGVNSNTELWKTDGTSAGTTLVDPVAVVGAMHAFGPLLLFGGREGTGSIQLWRSDGTEAGTFAVTDQALSFPPVILARAGDRMLLRAGDAGTGYELWSSDGTPEGTVFVEELNPGPASSFPGQGVAVGDLVFFDATLDAGAPQLWRSDGTAAGTFAVAAFPPGEEVIPLEGSRAATGALFFFLTRDLSRDMRWLWTSDGTPAGTRRVLDAPPPFWKPAALTGAGAHVVFGACDAEHGCEPWVSDGSEEGTVPLADVVPGSGSSNASRFFVAGDFVYFWAYDTAHGQELWAVPLASFQTGCANGLDDDGDGDVDFAGGDFGCSSPTDPDEHGTRACDDGIDNDGDGLVDYRRGGGGDPGCASWIAWSETSECQDGVNNDGRTGTDFDGGVSVLGTDGADPDGPDPDCGGIAWRNGESPFHSCGLGAELALLAPLLYWARTRRRKHRGGASRQL